MQKRKGGRIIIRDEERKEERQGWERKRERRIFILFMLYIKPYKIIDKTSIF